MQARIAFRDVVAEVRAELEQSRARAEAAGIARQAVLLDPGLGFGKTAEQSLALLAATAELAATGSPIVVGASRKSFVGRTTGAAVDDRLPGSLAAAAAAARGGAALLRVHDVAATRQFLAVLAAIDEQGGSRSASREERA
jgi:dihydropteroate synthase